ncbi:sugar-binding transcriptional regulator [Paenibacillus protaetiae]|uniref:Sugar-binding transcriptional regulator n=1 Tax=Paenibacillus protaetiae TaxID=2509456 RepID=A0A4P6F270_9BACL|nr:sugar-binding transcriptional regulator [Paenibacillus protaetiae]QAY67167.1 sugar-binding transcriptional regulator [Paenibacillus protaetiae]
MDELNDKRQKMIEAARMYYQLDYNQEEIAKQLGVSRPTVSRFLQQAKLSGIVQIRIVDPVADQQERVELLERKYGLKKAIVAPIPKYEDRIVKSFLGEAAADYLLELVKDGDSIAVTWGTTLYEVALKLRSKHVKGVSVVQLNGGVSHSEINTYAYEIAQLFGNAFHTNPYHLHLPAIVDHAIVRRTIEADRHVRNILNRGKDANIALVTVGSPTPDSVLMAANYFTPEDVEMIRSRGVGDICSRVIDINGNLCSSELNERTIGIELDELRHKETSILVAGGPSKIDAVLGALRGKYVNTLITDYITAQHLLEA